MKTLYRYIFYELFKTVIFTFLLFLFVILIDRASQIAETVIGQGVSFTEFLSVLVKTLPAFFGVVISVSFVISVLIVFLQMESNNEITVLRSCGVSISQISIPVLLLGILFSLFSLYSTMYLAPKSNVAVKKEIEELVKKKLTMSITPKNFSSNFPGVTFYVDRIFPKQGLIENFMVSLDRKDKFIVIFGREGGLRTENNTVFLDIYNGTAQVLNWEKPEEFQFLKFKNYTLELYKFSEGEKFEAKKYKTLSQLLKKRDSESLTEILKRLSLSLSSLIVGILIFSVSVSLPRGAYGMGIIISLTVIVLYYVLYVFSKKLALSSNFPPLTLLPDLVFGVLSSIFYYLAVKEKIRIYAGTRW
ncbi:MAG: permease [Thermovibrio sp.]|nr:MAG: permease [Thermovibrio sp.]